VNMTVLVKTPPFFLQAVMRGCPCWHSDGTVRSVAPRLVVVVQSNTMVGPIVEEVVGGRKFASCEGYFLKNGRAVGRCTAGYRPMSAN